MSGHPEVLLDQASLAQVIEHLQSCDQAFVPSLGSQVDLHTYAEKITAKSKRFEAWADGRLIGLVAAYCNDPLGCDAYITSVSVRGEWTGRGVANLLLDRCVRYARGAGFRRLRLEVGAGSAAAIHLYEKLGFVREAEPSELVRMGLQL